MGSDMAELVSRCKAACEAYDNHGCRCVGSPAFLERVVRHCKSKGIPSVFSAGYLGGAPIYSRLANLLSSELKETRIVYGSTEAEPISFAFVDERFQHEREAKARGDSHPGGHYVGKPAFSGGVAIIREYEGETSFLRQSMCIL